MKSALIVRRAGPSRHPVLTSLVWLVGAAAVVGIGHRIATGRSAATRFHNLWALVDALHPLVSASGALLLGAAALAVVALRRRRAAGPMPEPARD